MTEYPKNLRFESRGNRRGLSFKAGFFNIVRGELELRAASEEEEKHYVKVLAKYDVYPVGGTPPEAVLARENPSHPKARPRPSELGRSAKPEEATATLAGRLGDEVENPPDFVAPEPPKRVRGSKPAVDPDLPGAVS